MCPFWIPVEVRALTAAKFDINPMDATIIISSLADGLPNSSKDV